MNTTLKKSASLLLASGAALFLAAGCNRPANQPETTGNYIDDSAITAKVKAALADDDLVKSSNVHVATTHGVVDLTGTVDNSDQRSAAAKDASAVPGVKDVTNDLTVKQ